MKPNTLAWICASLAVGLILCGVFQIRQGFSDSAQTSELRSQRDCLTQIVINVTSSSGPIREATITRDDALTQFLRDAKNKEDQQVIQSDFVALLHAGAALTRARRDNPVPDISAVADKCGLT